MVVSFSFAGCALTNYTVNRRDGESPSSTTAVAHFDAISLDLSVRAGAVSPSKRHRPMSTDDEESAEGEGSPKHRRVEVDEGIAGAIAARAAALSDEELSRLFTRDL